MGLPKNRSLIQSIGATLLVLYMPWTPTKSYFWSHEILPIHYQIPLKILRNPPDISPFCLNFRLEPQARLHWWLGHGLRADPKTSMNQITQLNNGDLNIFHQETWCLDQVTTSSLWNAIWGGHETGWKFALLLWKIGRVWLVFGCVEVPNWTHDTVMRMKGMRGDSGCAQSRDLWAIFSKMQNWTIWAWT